MRSGAAGFLKQSGAAVGANMEPAAALSSVLGHHRLLLLETSRQNKTHSHLSDAVLWLWGNLKDFKGPKHKWKVN